MLVTPLGHRLVWRLGSPQCREAGIHRVDPGARRTCFLDACRNRLSPAPSNVPPARSRHRTSQTNTIRRSYLVLTRGPLDPRLRRRLTHETTDGLVS